MGYSYQALDRIMSNKELFKNKKILTLGVLYPYAERAAQKNRLRNKFGIDLAVPKERFSNHLFEELCGAVSCDVLDVSDYQGAKVICDLNEQIPTDCLEAYDLVLDAGTLEHLSNTSRAVNNIFSLLRPGGIYYFSGPCNGWVDHGFFQFSPTFYKDLVFHNSDVIELKELYFSSEKGDLPVMAPSNLVVTAFATSRKKFNVCGVMVKLASKSISFNLMQAKYRNWHDRSEDLPKAKKSKIRAFAAKIVTKFVGLHLVPFSWKYRLLKSLNRHILK